MAPDASSDPGWLPVGEEPQPSGNITHCVVLRNDGISSVSLPNGDIDASVEPSTGLYYRDTRYLSLFTFSFGAVSPVVLDATQTGQVLSAVFTNPAIRLATGNGGLPAQSLFVRRRRVISDRLREALSISNYSSEPQRVELRIRFGANFDDIFEVRGYARVSQPEPVQVAVDGHSATYRYRGTDGATRTSQLTFDPPPQRLLAGEAWYALALGPRETTTVEIQACPEERPVAQPLAEALVEIERQEQEWLEALASVDTDNEPLNAALRRSLLDIRSLLTRTGDDEYVAAGVPWFDTLFGRDSLITGIELLPFTAVVLRSALVGLARHQATATDPARDAAPGKIPHELRWGELAQAGEVPFGRYYGSIDATPLFVLAAYEYYTWTQDRGTIEQLWPAIDAAIAWCVSAAEAGGGFLAYSRASAKGLENQGWKDSHDSICGPDGRQASQPIAMVEVQGYLAAALLAHGLLQRELGVGGGRVQLELAASLRQRIEERFGDPVAGFALCLDGEGQPLATPSSNPGHLLWAGAASRKGAERAARRLMQPDLFSGWGLRTLSATVPGYNPLSYHRGSVWPHDTAMAVAGMRRYGFDDEAERLGSALLQAVLAFPDYRVPELFSGDARELRVVPTPYPVASRPQAWSAASVPYVLTSLLGLRPGEPGQMMVVRPMFPIGLEWVDVRNLRCGEGSIDLRFRRHRDRISVEVESIRGDVEVVLSRTWPEQGGREE